MGIIRNLLALIGLAAVIGAIVAYPRVGPVLERLDEFDEGAIQAYQDLANNLLETGDAAEAMVWKVKVAAGLSAGDVEQTMKFVANEHNIKNVGELPLSKEVAAMKGEDYRFVKIYMFCNALTASRMLDYNDAYSAFLPCRVSMVEDKTGQLWLYTLNMDLMIYGGKPLPPALRKEAMGVKSILLDIMKRGAVGDF